ncbi:MAG: hypothetical protein CMK32_05675 [Porticoccaceae bacterium]|nr:hypothetical protein [Porticoccaceae bacterium]
MNTDNDQYTEGPLAGKRCRRGLIIGLACLIAPLTAIGMPEPEQQSVVGYLENTERSPASDQGAPGPLPREDTRDSENPGEPGLMTAHSPAEQNRQLLALYQQQIQAQENLASTYDPALGETLTGMARVLQRTGNHKAALDAYQRALHIARVNDGIYSLSQEPMLRGMIDSFQAQGEVPSIAENYDQLYWLYTKSFGEDDPRLVPLLDEISEWHLTAYSQNPDKQGLYHLVKSHKLVAGAIEALSARLGNGTLTVLPLLHNLVLTNYYLADHQRRYPVARRQGFSFQTANSVMAEPLTQDEILVVNSYDNGKRAHEWIISSLYHNPDTRPAELASAMADLGDWYLLFGRTASARKVYAQAWQLAATDPDGATTPQALFGSPRLIPLQSGVLNGAADEFTGLDQSALKTDAAVARLTITDRGEVKSVVLEAPADPGSPDAGTGVVEDRQDDNALDTVTAALKQARFRPRLADGEMVATEDFAFNLTLAP